MSREAIEEAIEVLEDASAEMLMETGDKNYYVEAIAVLRHALETEKQEPVAWFSTSPDGKVSNKFACKPTESNWVEPLYTAPPKRELTCVCGAVWEGETMVHPPQKKERVGLTDEEFKFIASKYSLPTQTGMEYFKDELEAKLKEKNT